MNVDVINGYCNHAPPLYNCDISHEDNALFHIPISSSSPLKFARVLSCLLQSLNACASVHAGFRIVAVHPVSSTQFTYTFPAVPLVLWNTK